MSIETTRQRVEAATPGPWVHTGQGYDGRDGSVGESIDTQSDDYGDNPVMLVVGYRDNTDRDVEFVAHARQDIPALLRVAEAARDLIAAGCWGHADHSAERCRVGRLREAVEALEALP